MSLRSPSTRLQTRAEETTPKNSHQKRQKPKTNGKATATSPARGPVANEAKQGNFDTLRITEAGKIGRKSRFLIDTDGVLNDRSEFGDKLLCDGLTFTAGHSCIFTCDFCYVEDMLWTNERLKCIQRQRGVTFKDIVVEIAKAPEKVRGFLTSQGKPRFMTPDDTRTIFGSPLVDVAGTMEQVQTTVDICKAILELTNWQIRLLSKSALLKIVAERIPAEFKFRMIFGFSTGTVESDLASIFEKDTSPVSKRIESLHWLQDNGYRTYGMLCPILPQHDYAAYARAAVDALRLNSAQSAGQCEHVWAEVLNSRGESLSATANSLRKAGRTAEADLVERVAKDKSAWEEYAQAAFSALAEVIPPQKLRFLQYVDEKHLQWWRAHESQGAILLGKAAKIKAVRNGVVTEELIRPLSSIESEALRQCEKTIAQDGAAFVRVGLALKEIRDRGLFRETHASFPDYCRSKFDIRKAHAYRLMGEAVIVNELKSQSPIGDCPPLPLNECQARELVTVPRHKRAQILKAAASKAGDKCLNARFIREAKCELLSLFEPKRPRRLKLKSVISVETKAFLTWVAIMKDQLTRGKADEVLKLLHAAEQEKGIPDVLQTPNTAGKLVNR